MTRIVAQRMADAQDREQSRIVRIALRQAAAAGLRTRIEVIRAFRRGARMPEIRSILSRGWREQAPLVVDAMLVAHIAGTVRSVAAVEPNMPVGLSGAFEAAIQLLMRRASLSPTQIIDLRNVFGTQAALVTGDAFSLLEQKVQAAVIEATENPAHVRGGVQLIREAFDSAGATTDRPHLFETIYRTEISKAYNGGRWAADQDPDIQRILWGYEYVTVGDDRVRPSHDALDGMRLAKDDPRWKELWPPNGYNCRCSTVPIYATDKAVARVIEPKDGGGADEGFGFNFGDVLPE